MKSRVKTCFALLSAAFLITVFGCSEKGQNAETASENLGEYYTVNSETESEDNVSERTPVNEENERVASVGEKNQSAQSTDNAPTVENSKENILTVSLSDGKKGEELVGTLSIDGEVDLCAVDLKILFDSTKLKLTKIGSDDSDVLMNDRADDGGINLNYLKSKNVNEPFELCFFSFEVLTEESCESTVSIEVKDVVKMVGDDILDCPYTVWDGTCKLNGKE